MPTRHSSGITRPTSRTVPDEIFLDFYKVQKELEMSREQEKMSRRQNR